METDSQNPSSVVPQDLPPHQNTSAFRPKIKIVSEINSKETPHPFGSGVGGLSKGPMPSKGAILALVISNSVPLFGAIFWNWDIASILILFWLENVVIGFYTLLKIATAKGTPQQPIISNIGGKTKNLYSKKAYLFFFILHY